MKHHRPSLIGRRPPPRAGSLYIPCELGGGQEPSDKCWISMCSSGTISVQSADQLARGLFFCFCPPERHPPSCPKGKNKVLGLSLLSGIKAVCIAKMCVCNAMYSRYLHPPASWREREPSSACILPLTRPRLRVGPRNMRALAKEMDGVPIFLLPAALRSAGRRGAMASPAVWTTGQTLHASYGVSLQHVMSCQSLHLGLLRTRFLLANIRDDRYVLGGGGGDGDCMQSGVLISVVVVVARKEKTIMYCG